MGQPHGTTKWDNQMGQPNGTTNWAKPQEDLDRGTGGTEGQEEQEQEEHRNKMTGGTAG